VGGVAGARLRHALAVLDARPPHHDESVHGHFAHLLATEGAYRYDPTYHGPLLFLVTAGCSTSSRRASLSLRVYPAIAGVALVALPLALRRRVGPRLRGGAACPGDLASLLYYSRFARNDVPVGVVSPPPRGCRAPLRNRGARVVPWIGFFLALHAIARRRSTSRCHARGRSLSVAFPTGRDVAAGRVAWLRRNLPPATTTAALWFIAITVTPYTLAFIHPEDASSRQAVRYWYNQHAIERSAALVLPPPRLRLRVLAPGCRTLWVVTRRRPLRRWETICAGWGLSALALYAYLGRRCLLGNPPGAPVRAPGGCLAGRHVLGPRSVVGARARRGGPRSDRLVGARP